METNDRPVAIVTAGAGEGIGHGITEALCASGWAVILTDRKKSRADALVDRLRLQGGIVESIILDVTEKDAPERTVRMALEKFGRLDGLVNNAGVGLTKKVGEVSDEEFHALFQVDFMAAFRFVRAALPSLQKKGGAIVNIGSIHAHCGAPKYAMYAATKSALEAFTRGLAVDYGNDFIRANIVHPGLVNSPQNEALIANLVEDPKAWLDDFTQRSQCIPRLISSREVGDLVAFLLGNQSRMITGQAIVIDGGTNLLMWDNK